MGINQRYSIDNDRITYRIIDDEAVILDLDSCFYYNLNKTGTMVWRSLIEGKDLTRIIEEISREHQVPQKTVANDVKAIITEFKKEKLIEPER